MRTFIITTNRARNRFETLSRKLSSIGVTLPIVQCESFEVHSWRINQDMVYVPFISEPGQLLYYERRKILAECIKMLKIPEASHLYILLHIRDYYGCGAECLVSADEFAGLAQNVTVYRFHHDEPFCIADLWMEDDVTEDFCDLITQKIFKK